MLSPGLSPLCALTKAELLMEVYPGDFWETRAGFLLCVLLSLSRVSIFHPRDSKEVCVRRKLKDLCPTPQTE